ncbi:MAG: hypothetical protein GWO24_17205, partial [Akkermansiaceae bacterium]|nr:hypothetical protein [Akkermansiaceae bacterium]
LVHTYLFGAIAMVCGKRFQRLGDLAAGTMVVYADDRPHQAAAPVTASLPQPPPLEPLRPVMPRYPLHRDEQVAFASYRDRLSLWSQARRVELANHLHPLTRKEGPEAVNEVLRIGAWIEESK